MQAEKNTWGRYNLFIKKLEKSISIEVSVSMLIHLFKNTIGIGITDTSSVKYRYRYRRHLLLVSLTALPIPLFLEKRFHILKQMLQILSICRHQKIAGFLRLFFARSYVSFTVIPDWNLDVGFVVLCQRRKHYTVQKNVTAWHKSSDSPEHSQIFARIPTNLRWFNWIIALFINY